VAQGEAPAITNEYVASLRDVDAPPQGPVQPGAKFRPTAVRGIPTYIDMSALLDRVMRAR